MILRILKSNQPVNFILFPIIGLLFWGESLLRPHLYPFFLGENENLLYFPIDNFLKNSAFFQSAASLILLIILALMVQQINSRYTFIRIRTMLPAPLFVVMIGGLTEMHTLHPIYFAAVFLLLAIYRLFSMFDKPKPYSVAFDSGFLLGMGSLFYFNLFMLIPAFLIGITVLTRDYRWREFVVMIIGFLLPLFFAFSFAILTEHFMELLHTFESSIITANNHFKSNVPLHIFLGFLILLTSIGSIKIIQQYDSKKVSSRKYFTVFFLIFIFSVFSFILIPATSQEILVILAIPVSYLISNFLVFMKSKFWGELILTLLLGIAIFMQFVAN